MNLGGNCANYTREEGPRKTAWDPTWQDAELRAMDLPQDCHGRVKDIKTEAGIGGGL